MTASDAGAEADGGPGADTGSAAGTGGGDTPPGESPAARQDDAEATPDAPEPRVLVPLTTPREGVPLVTTTESELMRAAEALGSGTGPVSVDAERASGYRYGQRAYLVQIRRRGSGTWLIDPMGCPDLSPIEEALGDTEWVLHAATQDLPCLAEIKLAPRALFDTELGGRLAGLPRVGLGAMVEHYLGLSLAKEHSAADWSTRPLPEPWLRYAALDVEVLGELRDAVAADLQAQGKGAWAAQEFEALLGFTGPEPRTDPWRRTSGLNKVRTRRGLAMVREMWLARDRVARQRDTAPGRVIPDAAISEVATAHQRATEAPRTIKTDQPRLARSIARHQGILVAALAVAVALPEADLPVLRLPATGPPPLKAWSERDPVAAARAVRVRELLATVSTELGIPVENLLTPDLMRRYLWQGPNTPSTETVATALTALGARQWQSDITGPLIALACKENPLQPSSARLLASDLDVDLSPGPPR